jgi:formylglycine-generating enzyme required for sulfatase activity/flavodoxin
MKHTIAPLIALVILAALTAGGAVSKAATTAPGEDVAVTAPDNLVLIKGGSFQMGSPDSEAWRSADEKPHTVTVSDFYIDAHEVTQAAYQAVMGDNPSSFKGGKLPVENISWLEAIAYCNEKSRREGLTPAYVIEGEAVTWNRSADGYRLPTEAEWEYACRAGTATPFNTENSISAGEANYYGNYPYQIENNYFNQGNLETKPGQYRQKTVEVGSFRPNKFGLYDMHGNVAEWAWDYYGEYEKGEMRDPAGPSSGAFRVYRGGGWNDFAKNLRSAYRAALAADKASASVGLRLARNAAPGSGSVKSQGASQAGLAGGGKTLIAFFSWGGNTKGIAQQIQRRSGADLFEITLTKPYSSDYSTALDEAQRDQRRQARPEIAGKVSNIEQYGVILLGYPNWWASIPMPIATFLEQYDFSGKTIIPFCSHGGGRLGQSVTAIAKLAPSSVIGEPLSVHYSGGGSLGSDIAKWLEANGVKPN